MPPVPPWLIPPPAGEVGDLSRTGDTEATERAAVEAVLAAERGVGRWPTEMARNNPGFDIESLDADGDVWHIEVKGRLRGGDTFVMTHNEVRHSLNRPDRYVLAMVEVDPDTGQAAEVRYVARPFDGTAVVSVTTAQWVERWKLHWERGVVPR